MTPAPFCRLRRGFCYAAAVLIPHALALALARERRRALPHEACGLLLGRRGVALALAPLPNAHPDPTRHFALGALPLLRALKAARAGGWQVLAVYHSHPGACARPSAADRAGAAPGTVGVIVAAEGLRAWRSGKKKRRRAALMVLRN